MYSCKRRLIERWKGSDLPMTNDRNSTWNIALSTLGLSFLWAYYQKGFFATRLNQFPQIESAYSVAILLVSLGIFLVIAIALRKKLEHYFVRYRKALVLVIILAIISEVLVFGKLSAQVNSTFDYALCTIYYALQACLLIALFFGWIFHLMHIAYDRGLPAVIFIIITAQLVARILTSPYFIIWESFSAIETIFLLGVSAIFWLICTPTDSEPISYPAKVKDSSLTRQYLPAFAVYLTCSIASRFVQELTENSLWMQVFNPAREITLLGLLLLACVAIKLPEKTRKKLGDRNILFLIIGLGMGVTLGQLLGISTGSSTVYLAFNFIETTRAVLASASFILIFLIVYETSLSPVLAFGCLLVAPTIIERLLYLATLFVETPPVSLETLEVLLIPIGICFLIASLLLLVAFSSSNVYSMLFDAGKTTSNVSQQKLTQKAADDFQLTHREADIFQYLALGYTAKRIGEKLYISPFTVQNHIRCIYAKMGIHTKQEVLDYVEKWSEPE